MSSPTSSLRRRPVTAISVDAGPSWSPASPYKNDEYQSAHTHLPAYANATYTDKRKHQRSSFFGGRSGGIGSSSAGQYWPHYYGAASLAAGIVLAIFPWLLYSPLVSISYQSRHLADSIAALRDDRQQIIAEFKQATKQLALLQQEHLSLEHENRELVSELASHGDTLEVGSTVYHETEHFETALLDRLHTLKSTIRQNCYRFLLNKYFTSGQRDHVSLKFQVTLTDGMGYRRNPNAAANSVSGVPARGTYNPVPAGGKADPNSDVRNRSFVIETAPIDIMPVAIHHFLKMVEAKLWDGMTFLHQQTVRSGMAAATSASSSTVIHATPMDFITGEWQLESKFQAANITSMPFVEHPTDALGHIRSSSSPSNGERGHHSSHDEVNLYPIQKYSVVFEGKPGGPGWYINMNNVFVNNKAKLGGSSPKNLQRIDTRHHHTEESVFGQITMEGRPLLDYLMKQDRLNNGVLLVGIESIRLVR
jgi:hypothetical protein